VRAVVRMIMTAYMERGVSSIGPGVCGKGSPDTQPSVAAATRHAEMRSEIVTALSAVKSTSCTFQKSEMYAHKPAREPKSTSAISPIVRVNDHAQKLASAREMSGVRWEVMSPSRKVAKKMTKKMCAAKCSVNLTLGTV
jgi:hypothetical protein